jgi:hypothetical protein
VAVIGITILGIGIVMIVLPGPAIIVIPIALGILATEFVWAKRLLQWARRQFERYRNPNNCKSLHTSKEIDMGFDDLFKHRKSGYHNDREYYGGHRDEHHGHHGGLERYLYYFEKLKNNKKIWIAFSVAAIVIIIIFIAVILLLIPLIIKLFGTIQQSGISGLIDTVKPLLERLWSGTGK